MHDHRHLRALIAGVALSTFGGPTFADEIVPVLDITRVKVEQVQLTGSTVRALIINQGDQRIEDLRLRVSYQWLWRDEQRPGSHDPGWSITVPVTSPLAPGESRQFEFVPERPLAARPDGSYSPEVSVVGFNAYSQAGSAPAN